MNRKDLIQQIIIWAVVWALAALLVIWAVGSASALTPANSTVNNQAQVTYTQGGSSYTLWSNLSTFRVNEVIAHTLTALDIANVPASPSAISRVLSFRLTNTGNGNDTYSLMNTLAGGSGFTPSPYAIYLDSNNSGAFDSADPLYSPGVNDPSLAAGQSIKVFVVADIPSTATLGQKATINLASSTKIIALPVAAGTIISGGGDGGTDAIIGSSQRTASGTFEITLALTLNKTAVVTDPSGGALPVTGAVVEYTITVSTSGPGTATGVVIADTVPAYTTYMPGTLTLQSAALSDSGGNDAGDFGARLANSVSIDLGNLDSSSGTRTIKFKVKID